jgi:hypothetical protein
MGSSSSINLEYSTNEVKKNKKYNNYNNYNHINKLNYELTLFDYNINIFDKVNTKKDLSKYKCNKLLQIITNISPFLDYTSIYKVSLISKKYNYNMILYIFQRLSINEIYFDYLIEINIQQDDFEKSSELLIRELVYKLFVLWKKKERNLNINELELDIYKEINNCRSYSYIKDKQIRSNVKLINYYILYRLSKYVFNIEPLIVNKIILYNFINWLYYNQNNIRKPITTFNNLLENTINNNKKIKKPKKSFQSQFVNNKIDYNNNLYKLLNNLYQKNILEYLGFKGCVSLSVINKTFHKYIINIICDISYVKTSLNFIDNHIIKYNSFHLKLKQVYNNIELYSKKEINNFNKNESIKFDYNYKTSNKYRYTNKNYYNNFKMPISTRCFGITSKKTRCMNKCNNSLYCHHHSKCMAYRKSGKRCLEYCPNSLYCKYHINKKNYKYNNIIKPAIYNFN